MRVEDRLHRRLGRALAVGVLDAQDELAAVLARVGPGEQRGARAADVQIAGGAGGEAGADFHSAADSVGAALDRQALARASAACRRRGWRHSRSRRSCSITVACAERAPERHTATIGLSLSIARQSLRQSCPAASASRPRYGRAGR